MMGVLETVGAIALWVAGWWLLGSIVGILLLKIGRPDAGLSSVIVPIYAAIAIWGIGVVSGLVFLGKSLS